MIETFAELLICSMVTNVPSGHENLFDAESWTPADKFMLVFTIAIQVVTVVFLAVSFWFLMCVAKPIQKQLRIEEMEEETEEILKFYLELLQKDRA